MLYVELFGIFKMNAFGTNDETSIPLPAKSGCVLAYILLNRQRAIPKEELVDAFWSNPRSSNPLNAFKTLLFRIISGNPQCRIQYHRLTSGNIMESKNDIRNS